MSHGSEQNEDYWPGYVDALTSMVQVLAFVMMMLAVTVFVMSQSISKGAVEQIAKVAKVAFSPSSSVKELTEKIVERLNEAKAETPVQPETQAKVETQAKAETPVQTETQAKVETQAKPEARPEGNSPANVTVKQSAAVVLQAQAEKSTEIPPDAQHIVLHFPDRSARLDAAGAEQVNGFADEIGLAAGKMRVVIHAFAASGSGAVTEGRRLAYTRAMVARQALTLRKVPPTSIAIRMIDTADPAQGGKIEIYAVPAGAP